MIVSGKLKPITAILSASVAPNENENVHPPADLNASGISTPKYNGALYGQNASANNAPNKNAPAPFHTLLLW